MKKTPGGIDLHKYTKNNDHMLHCSWDTMRDGSNFYFPFWAILAVLPLTIQKSKFTENEKTAEGIIILQMHTKNYDHMMYRMDRQMDGWKYWHIMVGTPPSWYPDFDTLQKHQRNTPWNHVYYKFTKGAYFYFWSKIRKMQVPFHNIMFARIVSTVFF